MSIWIHWTKYVNRELRPACYIRYVDDFLLFGQSRVSCPKCGARWKLHSKRFVLLVHQRKSRVYRCADGDYVSRLAAVPGEMRGWCGRMWCASGGACARWSGRLALGPPPWMRFVREFTRGLGTQPPGILGVCGNSYLRNSRWRRGVLSEAIRGGSWNNNARRLRVSNRNRNQAEERNDNIGFRCVRDEERRRICLRRARVPAGCRRGASHSLLPDGAPDAVGAAWRVRVEHQRRRRPFGSRKAKTGRRASSTRSIATIKYVLHPRHPGPHRHRSLPPRLSLQLWRARQRRRAGLRPRRELFLLGQPAPQSVR